jgi:hypothetical protein
MAGSLSVHIQIRRLDAALDCKSSSRIAPNAGI